MGPGAEDWLLPAREMNRAVRAEGKLSNGGSASTSWHLCCIMNCQQHFCYSPSLQRSETLGTKQRSPHGRSISQTAALHWASVQGVAAPHCLDWYHLVSLLHHSWELLFQDLRASLCFLQGPLHPWHSSKAHFRSWRTTGWCPCKVKAHSCLCLLFVHHPGSMMTAAFTAH